MSTNPTGEERYTPLDPSAFAQYVEKSYRLYRRGLLTAKEFADVTGENLRNQMNYREDPEVWTKAETQGPDPHAGGLWANELERRTRQLPADREWS